MPNPSTTRLWRLLILDPELGDPKWILATVAGPDDVRPAGPADTAPDEVTRAWAGAGTLAPLPGALCWRADTGR